MDKKQEFNFDDNFTINNDQGLEEEELKDRIRREEEIHDLLTRAMGHCSLTDDSSINSSSHTAIETTTDPPLLSTNDPEKQYLESNIDEQLKVLYEIRCREVVELTEQLQKNRAELKEREGVSKTKLALLELENERKNISLQEAQNLLVDKTDQAKELNKQLDNIKYMVTCLEGNLAEVNEEKEVLRQLNLSLEQQMHLMEKNGFSLMNKSSDRELREQLNNKIQQLEQSLQSALKQNELREKQHSELIRELQQNLQEKDDRLAEKGFLINKLTENFEAAQSQCHELLKTVSELRDAEKIDSDSKDLTKHSPLNEELLKIRENKERFEMCENVRKAVTDEFQAHINSLTSMNQILNEKILAQEKRLGEALRNGEIISTIEKEKEILQGNVDDLENKLRYTTRENEKYQKQLAVLADANSKNADISLQTSFAHINISDFENIHKENKKLSSELESALAFIHKLEAKFSQLHEENSHLKIKIGLEQERDTLIQELKEKAIICEKLIKEKQENYRTEQINVISVGINTEQYDEVNNSLLKLQYDTLLYQREADLRNALQREFDSKHETLLSRYKEQFSKLAACQECESLKADVKQMSEDRKEDRMAVLNFVGTWQSKINEVGINSDQRYKECLALMDKEYTEKFKTLADMIQEQFLKERKQEEHNMYQSRTRLNNRISDSINKIVSKIQQGDNEVKQITSMKSKEAKLIKKKHLRGT